MPRPNSFIDAARAHRESAHLFGRPEGGAGGHGGTVLAFNASGENAPMHGLVELKPTGQTQRQVEFVKPGAPGGAGIYGIAVDPVPAESMGTVACSGGPWPLLVDAPDVASTPGRVCGPDMSSDGTPSSSWLATSGSAVFAVVRAAEEIDGAHRALVRFRDAEGIYQVTEVAGDSCTVGWPDSDGDVVPGTEIEGVLYDATRPPITGDRGILTVTADSHLFFLAVASRASTAHRTGGWSVMRVPARTIPSCVSPTWPARGYRRPIAGWYGSWMSPSGSVRACACTCRCRSTAA
ncbi:MAG: hypothetical protein ACLFWL_09040 [Candidatus Brocadiia bacterium]